MNHYLVELMHPMKILVKILITKMKLTFFFVSFGYLDIKEFSQKILRYLKTSQRTLALPVGEVMLNRKGRLYVVL